MTFRALRKSKGMTIEALAFSVGCSVSTIGRIDREKANSVGYPLVKKISKVLGPEVMPILEAQLKTKKDTK